MKIYKNEDVPFVILPFENFNGREIENFNGHRALMEKFIIMNQLFSFDDGITEQIKDILLKYPSIKSTIIRI